ncbi:hypothetical protein SEA_SHAM4_66 [Mycobacterium phage Sham4]|nr:hypothetical protein SEA_SNAPE_66 [Mycobacterium phage Snape]QBI97894.1 hypothetical protein SEA_ORANGE_65 [Mycobacterium phage Orange]QBI98235.1 hypothetical protein SEA_BOWTIE_67 [Mycobacterium phage Bowtie]QPX61991.1 hypothetical protein SEA_FLAVERINT_67 [Mycobacterium phage Flaverint]UAW08937.1 hypothetical protein SEA_LUCIVIA_67 [Mycobacterium phage Lucivia]UAW09323.1 hypothetical protein SEA_TIMOTHY_66 [Mycobacterium phage Timothy]UOW92711.1 hypothetical protein SEA_SHAM4_66 [Mycobac
MATPNSMPRKVNPLHKQILTGLTKVRQNLRKETRVTNVRRDADGVYHHELTTKDVPVPTLAANVSQESLDRLAERWL